MKMKRLIVAIAAALTIASQLAAVPAHAAEADMYVFGTSLVLTSPRQLTDPNTGWWAELLPMEYSYASGSIVKAVNAARAARGVKEMIDYKLYPVSIGGETAVDGGYEYNIDFQRMTPDDVAAVQAQFPLQGVLGDLKTELRPLRIGYFNTDNMQSGGTTLTLDMLGQKLVFSDSDSFASARDKVANAVAAYFGDRAKIDFSYSRTTGAAAGMESASIYVTIYLDGAESMYPGGQYEGEGGE
jgi:hypothetical protein